MLIYRRRQGCRQLMSLQPPTLLLCRWYVVNATSTAHASRWRHIAGYYRKLLPGRRATGAKRTIFLLYNLLTSTQFRMFNVLVITFTLIGRRSKKRCPVLISKLEANLCWPRLQFQCWLMIGCISWQLFKGTLHDFTPLSNELRLGTRSSLNKRCMEAIHWFVPLGHWDTAKNM